MKASLKWLNEYIDLKEFSPEAIGDKLTFAGIECDGVRHMASATNLVIGHILSCEPHPDSDHLHILQVDEGKEYGVQQIVCGAPNARKGLNVIVARPGAKLPEIEIKPSLIRGVESNGMCCALYELGVDKKFLSEKQASGIEELPEDAPIGETDVLGYLGLDDAILDLDLLANRPDLYSILNIAKECGALFHKEAKIPEPKKHSLAKTDFKVGSSTKDCPQFAVRIVKNVKIGPSPKWLQQRLLAEGIRSINNVVDIGNYVMLLTGEPLNMYDLDKLPEPALIVRDDLEGEWMAMDGKKYNLQKGDLQVTSGGRCMCLAGIMTSEECKVDENTKNLAVESAVFSGAPIRHTSNRIGLSSDSSLRFVKGVNPHQAEYVLSLTSDLLEELCGATSISETANYDTLSHERKKIDTTLNYLNKRLGTHFTSKEVVETLQADHFEVKETKEGEYSLLVPEYRIDIDGEADISEELIRLRGYENVVSTLPEVKLALQGRTPKQKLKETIRHALRLEGLDEVLTYTLVNDAQEKQFAYLEKGEAYSLLNPLTEERKYVRKNLLPSLLETASYNFDHGNKDLGIFEISDVDPKGKAGLHLALVLLGNKQEQGSLKQTPYDFYDLKGHLESIMEILSLGKNRYQILPWNLGGDEFHPGKAAELRMGKTLLGVFGELHPTLLAKYGFKNACALELDLGALLDLKSSQPKASIPARFPSVTRDLAFLIDEDVPYADVERALKKSDALLKEVQVFDVYQGAMILAGKKSMAVHLVYLDETKTLKDEEIASAMKKAILTLQTTFGAEVRS